MRWYDRPADAGQNIIEEALEPCVETVQENVNILAGGQSVYAGSDADIVNS